MARPTAIERPRGGWTMVAAIVVLLLIALLFGLGFAVKALLWVALVLFVLWLIGFAVGGASAAGAEAGARRRWYYW